MCDANWKVSKWRKSSVELNNDWLTASPSVDQYPCISTNNNNRPSYKEQRESLRQAWVGKCYGCGEPGHKINECPKRKQVHMTNYEDDGKEEVKIEELNDSNFAEEQGDSIACVVQRLLCNQKALDTTQRHQIFYARCSVKSKVCNLIISNKSNENIVSRALMDYLKLET